MNIAFSKMHGLGNDFIVVSEQDWNRLNLEDSRELAIHLCNRTSGIGADGLLLVNLESAGMKIFNSDGSIPEMCGNGLRVAAKFFQSQHPEFVAGNFLTGAGDLLVEFIGEEIKINMGPAIWDPAMIGMRSDLRDSFIDQSIIGSLKGSAVSFGNPHLVLFVQSFDHIDLAKDGPLLEKLPLFTNGTNVHFAMVVDDSRIKQITWERGAGATLACGTGACAVASVAHRLGLCQSSVTIELPGGNLKIDVEPDSVWMTGPAEFVYSGSWEIPS